MIDSWGSQKGSSKFSRITKRSRVLICFHMYVLSTFVSFYNVCIESSTVFSSTVVSRIETYDAKLSKPQEKIEDMLTMNLTHFTINEISSIF